jgi:hypothetical protein
LRLAILANDSGSRFSDFDASLTATSSEVVDRSSDEASLASRFKSLATPAAADGGATGAEDVVAEDVDSLIGGSSAWVAMLQNFFA